MNTYSNTNSSAAKTGAIQESAAQFESDLAKADTVRASALAGLQRLRAARANHAQREQTWLAANSEKDHPDVIRLQAEVAVERRFGSALDAELDRVNSPAPVVSEHGWALHGFVRDQNLQGQPKLTVAMFDSTNRWVEALGHTCTDSRGYFQLCFAGGKESAVEQWREIFVRVSDAKQQVLYRDKKPMSAVLGEVRYREIIIGAESATCPPPSDDSSRGAGPKTKVPAPESQTRKVGSKKKTSKKAKAEQTRPPVELR
jgi:hypothetical protein